MHDRGRANDREQSRNDEELALAQPADKSEKRIENEAAHKDQPDHGQHRVEGERPADRRARVRRPARHRSDDRDHRNDREVLEQ